MRLFSISVLFSLFVLGGCSGNHLVNNAGGSGSGGGEAGEGGGSVVGVAGGNSVNGSVNGQPFVVADAISGTLSEWGGGSDRRTGGEIVMTNKPGACAAQQQSFFAGVTDEIILDMEVFEQDDAGSHLLPTHSGVYTIINNQLTATGAGLFAAASWSGIQAGQKTSVVADSGTITLDGLADVQYQGSFQFTFGSDPLSGHFNASFCANN
jgi:hypothetical protein